MRLLLKNQKYAQALLKMNINHGLGFDCMNPDCRVCKPYRDKEIEEWNLMREEQKKKYHRGMVG